MAGNRFDFELVAKDEASATLKALEDTVAKMLPDLEKAGSKMQLGGKNTIDGLDDLNTRLDKMGNFAKAGVQYFGDIVPPLKLVGELAGSFGGAIGKIGVGGAVAYGAGKAVTWLSGQLRQAGKDAYELGVQSMDAGMSIHDLTQVAGGMEILGADTDKARSSVESLSRALTDAMNNRQSTITGVLNQIGAPIVERADHTADTMKTLENLAKVFPTLSAQKQRTVADALGLSPEMLTLLRQGLRYKQLMAESDKYGLTMTDQQIEKLSDINTQYSELDARLDGMWRKLNIMGGIANRITLFDHSDAAIKSVADSQKYDKDDDAHFYHGSREQDILHRARRDADFKKSLSFREGIELAEGKPGKTLQAKLDAKYLTLWRAQALQSDLNTIYHPVSDEHLAPVNNNMYDQPRNNSLGLRNHNPLNLRAAPNETGKVFSGKNGFFSRFGSDEDGLAAASRQLFLYGDRGKHTLQDVIRTFAPPGENNVENYVSDVSRDTGFKPGENIDLHSPDILKRLLPAMIKEEQGTQPFSSREIDVGIQDAIFDPRWRGLRDPDYLLAQRNQRGSETEPAVGEHNAILTPQSPGQREPEYLSARRDHTQREERPGIITPDQTADLTKALRDIIAQAGKNGKAQLEVTLTSANGEHKRVLVPFGGRVTTSMTPY
ncbi:hypothetical protein [Enterobacter kobei]|uniref:hypothetical protein n=1 Tax=Enterobacter kobei TaxID=208224 RepID=UPI003CFAF14E